MHRHPPPPLDFQQNEDRCCSSSAAAAIAHYIHTSTRTAYLTILRRTVVASRYVHRTGHMRFLSPLPLLPSWIILLRFSFVWQCSTALFQAEVGFPRGHGGGGDSSHPQPARVGGGGGGRKGESGVFEWSGSIYSKRPHRPTDRASSRQNGGASFSFLPNGRSRAPGRRSERRDAGGWKEREATPLLPQVRSGRTEGDSLSLLPPSLSCWV